MSASLGEAVLNLIGDDTKLIGTTTNAKSKVESILGKVGTGMAAVGSGVVAAGAAITAVGGGILKLTTDAAGNADQILALAQTYHLTTDQIQTMKYAAELVDVPLETMLGSFTRLTMAMSAAKDGTGEHAKIFESLGVNVIDPLTGKLRDQNSVWLETIDALGKISNPTERDAMSLKLFGRSAADLNPLISAGTEKLKALGVEAQASGAILSSSQLTALGDVDDAMQRMKNGAGGVLNQLGGIFAPGVANVVGKVSGYLGKLGSVLGSNLDLKGKVKAGTELVQTIASDIATNLPKLAESGISILKSLVQGLIASGPTLMPAAISVVKSLLDFVIDMAPILIDGASQILVALGNGLGSSLPTLIPKIVEMVLLICNTLLANLPQFIQAGISILMGLIQGLTAAIPILIQQVPILVSSIVSTILNNLPLVIESAIQLVFALIQGLISAIPSLVASIPQLIMAVSNAFLQALPQLLQMGVTLVVQIATGIGQSVSKLFSIGQNLMNSFLQGLKSKFEEIWKAVTSFAGSIIDAIKNVLQIHSPSPLLIGLGAQVGYDLGTGVESNLNFVASKANRLGRAISGSASDGLMSVQQNFRAAMSAKTNENHITVYNPVAETAEKSIKKSLQNIAYFGTDDQQ